MSKAYRSAIMRGRILLGRQPQVASEGDPVAQKLATAPARPATPTAPQRPVAPTAPQPPVAPAAPAAPARPIIRQPLPNPPQFYPESGYQPGRFTEGRKPMPGVDTKPLSAAERILQRKMEQQKQREAVA